jgi:hypothetical protein
MLFVYNIKGFVEKITILKNNDIFAIVIFIQANNFNFKIANADVIFDKKKVNKPLI